MSQTDANDFIGGYAKAVESLAPELRSLACQALSTCDSYGTWRIRDSNSTLLGQIKEAQPQEVRQATVLTRSERKSYVTSGVMEGFAEGVGKMIGRTQKAIAETQKALIEGVQALSERVSKLERRSTERGIRWAGGFSRDARYDRGDLISYGGSLWICCADDCTSLPMADQNWQRLLRSNKNGTFSEGDFNDN